MLHPSGSSSSLLFLLTIVYVFFYSLTSVFSDENFTSCNTGFKCGKQKHIGYPFWGSTRPKGCGHPDFELECNDGYPEMIIKETKYRVLLINNTAYTMRIVRREYADNLCPESLDTVSFDFSHFVYALPQATRNISLYYECTYKFTNEDWSNYSSNFECIGSVGFNYYIVQDSNSNPYLDDMLKEIRNNSLSCGNTVDVTVTSFPSQIPPVNPSITSVDTVTKAINYGFTVEWSTGDDKLCGECKTNGGQCGNVDGGFVWYCPDKIAACDEFQRSLPDESYTSCSTPLECGNQKWIGYPFYGSTRQQNCGYRGFELNCSGEYPEMKIKDKMYRVLKIDNTTNTLRIARTDYVDNLCPASPVTASLDFSLFEYAPDTQNITLYYECPNKITDAKFLTYSTEFDCGGSLCYYVAQDLWFDPTIKEIGQDIRSRLGSCKKTVDVTTTAFKSQVPPIQATNVSTDTLKTAIDYGFTVKWSMAEDALCFNCQNYGGRCGNENGFKCYCPDESNNSVCSVFQSRLKESTRKSLSRKVVVALSVSLAGLVVAFIMAIFIYKGAVYLRRKKSFMDHQNVEAFIRNNRSLTPKRFNYSDVKKMTSSFSNIVGKGGFGSVYKGKLPDGSLVAVKVLSKMKETESEDFINEVASMSRTSHVNIVSLLGFCYDGTNRALIYEFVTNGSLDKFIYDQGITPTTNHNLELETLDKIAVGVARGLEYLHRGCNTRIVHFDIKPHNILLDDDFCPKISDFGLAKLSQTKESILSMLGTRGTIGYIAPEVFSRNFGRVSHKSDVYSYGMMVLEMVGGRRNFDRRVSHTSEMYFPDWIYNQMEPTENLLLSGDLTEDEERRAKKMLIVGLWCIQTIPSNRPTMSKVVEMLEGNLEPLQIPPKPSFSSPEESFKKDDDSGFMVNSDDSNKSTINE